MTDDKTKCSQIINLISQDEVQFQVEKRLAIQSELIKTMIDDPDEEGDQEDEEDQYIPLPNVKAVILTHVIEFFQINFDNEKDEPRELNIPKPIQSTEMSEIVESFYVDYINKFDQEVLFEIILAANYMDIQSLLDLSCAKVASMIKGKSPEDIRSTFNIVNDFTPEEEAQIREENKWCDDS